MPIEKIDYNDETYTIIKKSENRIYKPLLFAMLERITPLQLEDITIDKKDNKIINFKSILDCFTWINRDGCYDEDKSKCICGHSIMDLSFICNKETNIYYPVGNVCIDTYLKDMFSPIQQNNFKKNKKMTEYKKKETEEEINQNRCYFCLYKKCKGNCNDIQFIKKYTDKWKSLLKRHSCTDCKRLVDIKYLRCYTCDNKTKSNKCDNCGLGIKPNYRYCWTCKNYLQSNS
jgi:hypothetical protein